MKSSEASPLLSKEVFNGYMSTCKEQGILPSADAMIRMEMGMSRLVVQNDAERPFGNLELKALVDFLEANDGAHLKQIKYADFSRCKLGISSALLLSRMLRHPQCNIEELNLSKQPIGVEGIQALAKSIPECKSLRRLNLRSCWIGDRGAEALVEMLWAGDEEHQLEHLDLQNNLIEYRQCRSLSKAAEGKGVDLELQGNRVLDEVWNAITHGGGFVLAAIGSVYVAFALRGKPAYYVEGMVPYLVSLNGLFLASCLYHSFHALGRTVTRIFCNLDHSGIYALIAGTYTPFLVILFHGLWWAKYFLWFIWLVAFAGVLFTVKYEGEYKMHVENFFYLLMGWVCILWIQEARERLEPTGFWLLVAGGILYSLGVPWFVKDGHTLGFPDHNIWHLFVLAAAGCHFICIYKYVLGGSFDLDL